MFALVIPDVKGKLANMLPTEKLESDLAESMRKPLMTVCSKATTGRGRHRSGEGLLGHDPAGLCARPPTRPTWTPAAK